MIRLDRKSTPRWLIVVIDITIVFLAAIIAYLLRFNFEIPEWELGPMPWVVSIIVGVRLISFFIGKTYSGILRYTSTHDVSKLVIVMTGGSLFFVLINLMTYYAFNAIFYIPFSIIIIEFLTSTLGLAAIRIIVKITYLEMSSSNGAKVNVIIFGAGEAGVLTKRVLERDAGSRMKVFAFVDDNQKKSGKKIEGVEIHPTKKLGELLEKHKIDQVIISVQEMKPEKKQKLIETCLENNVRVLNVPPIVQWINGELSFNQIKKINIEDLLGREVIKLKADKIREEIQNKCVLITGASGSIGSELVRQVAGYRPAKLILYDQSETPLFHQEIACHHDFPDIDFEMLVGDICNQVRLRNVFEKFRPEFVYHAAAYKHVPMMESNPAEAVYTNILGSKIVADLSLEFSVSKFIMISSDKAVNPTNVMGASKRIAEIYIQSLDQKSTTRFITTRFGNVLGSNGSVIPLFREQIEQGGPITITHPEITRYFMTIPEACQLVMEAGAMGQGGEIFLFNMGKSVKILDLARKMIKLSGLELGKDMQIKYIGLRPGEKLYEELLTDKENTMPTHHPQIMIAKVDRKDHEIIAGEIEELIALTESQDDFRIVKKMKNLVPEFISKNSVYEQLDKARGVE